METTGPEISDLTFLHAEQLATNTASKTYKPQIQTYKNHKAKTSPFSSKIES